MGRTIKCIVDGLLLLLLAGQTMLLITFIHSGYWEIPRWLLHVIAYGETPEGTTFDVDSFRFYPKKGIEIKGVSLNSDECVCPLITIEKLLIVPSDPLLKNCHSAEGLLQNAVVFFPDPYLPAEENLKLIDGLSFRFYIDKELLRLESLKAQISNLSLSSLNALEVDMDFLESYQPKPDESEEASPDDILRKLRELRFVHQYFESAEEALLTATFHQHAVDHYSVDLNLFAASSRMEEKISTQGITLSGKVVWDDEIYVDGTVNGEFSSMRWGDQLLLQQVAVEMQYFRDGIYSLIPNKIRAHSAELIFDGKNIDYLGVEVEPDNLTSGELTVQTGVGNQFLTGKARYDTETEFLDASIRGDFDPLILAKQWLGPIEKASELAFVSTPYLAADFSLRGWNNPTHLGFRIISQNVSAKEVPFDYARASGKWDNDTKSVNLDHFVATRSNYSIEGKAYKNLETTDYRYLIWGTGVPSDLNPMFKPWWTATWKDFDFNDHTIAIDIDIWGTENDEQKRNVYGAFSFENLIFKNVLIDHGQVRLNAVSKYVDLFDLYIKRQDGIASGRVENVYQVDGDNQVSQHLDIYTNIPLHQIAPLVGEDLDPIVENTNPEACADVWVKGALIMQEFPEFAHLDHLQIKLHVDQPTDVFGFNIDAADAIVNKRGLNVVVDPLTFDFAKGKGRGIFTVSGPKDEQILDFDVDIHEFDFRVAIEKVEAFQPKPDEDEQLQEAVMSVADSEQALDIQGVSEDEVSAHLVEAISGEESMQKEEEDPNPFLKMRNSPSFMNLTLVGTTPVQEEEDLSLLDAKGWFTLDDPLIHRVHMFGGFSKVMDNAELNLGSFSLKQATSPIRIIDGFLYLDNMQLTGPSSKVVSKGSVEMETGALDFRMKAYPLDEVKFPLVAGLALFMRPFAHIFEVKVMGTLEEPEWKVVIDPSGL